MIETIIREKLKGLINYPSIRNLLLAPISSRIPSGPLENTKFISLLDYNFNAKARIRNVIWL
jgi:hypothetical protein